MSDFHQLRQEAAANKAKGQAQFMGVAKPEVGGVNQSESVVKSVINEAVQKVAPLHKGEQVSLLLLCIHVQ